MRDIKFRGQQINTKKWIYGYLYKEKGLYLICENIRYAEEEPIFLDTVGQYTGLKDENGKEIYEGDIIEFSYDMFVGYFDTFIAKGKVVFEEGAFYVEVFENERITKDEAYLLYSINLDTIELMGNIYDNPELLAEKE